MGEPLKGIICTIVCSSVRARVNSKLPKRDLVLTLLCLVSLSIANAQSPREDFIRRIDQIKTEKSKYNEILRYEKNRQEPLTKVYIPLLTDAIKYFNSNGKPRTALPIVNTVAGYYIFGDHVDHDQARKVLNAMVPLIGQLPLDTVLLNYHVLFGELSIYTNHLKEAIDEFKTIINLSIESGDTLNANFGYAYLKLAEIYSSEWNILESDRYFKEAADLFLGQKDTTMYLWALSGQSTLYSINGMYHEANFARQKILSIGLHSGSLQVVAISHISAALEFMDRNMDSLQYFHLTKAKQYINFESDVTEYIRTITYALLTQYFSNQGVIDSTDYYMNRFSQFYEPGKHGPWIEDYFRIARTCQAKVHGHFLRAERMTLEMMEEAKHKNKLTNLTRLYELLVGIYVESGNTSKAFKSLESYNNLNDSLKNIQINNQFLFYNHLFQSERKDKQILQQEASIQLLSEKNKVLFWRGLLVILCIFGLFLIIYLLRSYQFSRQKSALQQGFSQNLIQQQEKERTRISQELHDGISQELILIKNKLDKEQNVEAATLVAGSLSQLRQVSRSLYPAMLKSFGLKLALEQLFKKVDRATPDMEIHYEIYECEGFFSKKEKLHLYRIVQEAINNVLKYAQCSQLEIVLKEKRNDIILVVKDNGIGFDLNNRAFLREGIGLNSMEERAKILGGSFQLKSAKGKGTRIEVIIPEK